MKSTLCLDNKIRGGTKKTAIPFIIPRGLPYFTSSLADQGKANYKTPNFHCHNKEREYRDIQSCLWFHSHNFIVHAIVLLPWRASPFQAVEKNLRMTAAMWTRPSSRRTSLNSFVEAVRKCPSPSVRRWLNERNERPNPTVFPSMKYEVSLRRRLAVQPT